MTRLLIDCSCLCYRSLYTMGDLSNDQKRVGVIFGFIKQILTLAKKFETNKFVFCWDSRNSYRKLEYPWYKSSRRKDLTEEQNADFQDAFRQFDEVRELVLPMMGFKNNFQQNGYEGDDLIAYVACRFPDETIIVSSDNDLLQLIESSRYCSIKFYNFKDLTDKEIFQKTWFGLDPIKWAMVKSIAGCSSDEIPGISGVGEQTAAKYLAGLLPEGKSKDKIESSEGKALFLRNMNLVALPYNGIKAIKITGIEDDEISEDKFKAIFGQYGFRSLIKDEEVKKWSKLFFNEVLDGQS